MGDKATRFRAQRKPIAMLGAVLVLLVGITISLHHRNAPQERSLPLTGTPTSTEPTTPTPDPSSATTSPTTAPSPPTSRSPTTADPTVTVTHTNSRPVRASGKNGPTAPIHTTYTTTSDRPPAPASWPEQAGNRNGVPTFLDTKAMEEGPDKIPYGQIVTVSCKVYDPSIETALPGGYWYRIKSSPWNDRYYAVANTFTNGDVLGDPNGTHNVDSAVRDC